MPALTRSNPCLYAQIPNARVPGTFLTSPSRLNSPTNNLESKKPRSSWPVAAKIPSAIGKSKPVPLFLMSLGERFTTIFFDGILYPLDVIALLTRSLASCTAVSAIPTIDIPGRP